MSEWPALFHDPAAIELEQLRLYLRRIEENTRLPFGKESDLDYLRCAVSLANIYARAALAPLPEDNKTDTAPIDDRLERRRREGHQ